LIKRNAFFLGILRDNMGISPIIILKDAITLDYCFIQCIQRCLEMPYVDSIYINEGYSTDGTFEVLSQIKSDKVKIVQRKWSMDKGFWSREKNFLIDLAKKESEYILIVDADEVLLKSSFKAIQRFMENPQGKMGMIAQVFHYFRVGDGYGLDSLRQVSRRGWYRYQARILHRDVNPQLAVVGDNPDDLVGFVGKDVYFLHHCPVLLLKENDLRFAHFGYARDAQAMSIKSTRSDAITKGSNEFVEGTMPSPGPYTYPTLPPGELVDPFRDNPGLKKDELVAAWLNSKYRKVSYP
jgi:hypothetical protein